MRHQRAGLHLSRTSAHRRALFSNLVASLFTYERIRTTDAKAKQTRRLAERTITLARRLGDVLTKDPESRSQDEKARVVHAVRLARRVVRDRGAVVKLFDEIGPRYLGRPGGYTRIIKLGTRPGDAAPISILELIPDGQPAGGAAEKTEPAAKAAPAKKKSDADKPSKGAAAEKAAKTAKPTTKAAKGKSSEEGSRGAAKQRAKGATGGGAKAKPAAKSKGKKPGKGK